MKIDINPADFSILVCDDEESIRSMLGEVIKEWGFPLATAPNGEAALEYIQAGNTPHIILTDIRMGGITGIELAEKAKQISDEIEVIIMTSHGTLETAVQAMRIGVFDYLTKPFDNIEDVRKTLVHVAERIYLRLYNEYLINEIQAKNQEILRHAEMSEELARSLDVTKIVDVSCVGLSRAFDEAPVAFLQFSPAQKSLMATVRRPLELFGKTQPKMLLPAHALKDVASIEAYIRKIGDDPAFQDFLKQALALNPPTHKCEGGEWKFAPLITRGIVRGVFAIYVKDWNEKQHVDRLARYTQTLTTHFENALLHHKVVETSITDGLTTLFNVRYFKQRFVEELNKATRLHHPLSLIFFDVDHFKKYNDANGHPAGDEVLRIFGRLIKQAFRNTDVRARYGGEEFVILMPHTSFADALTKAEAFRALVEKTPFPLEETQPLGRVTASIGVAEFPSHGNTMEQILKASDDALYEGKKKSRNVVIPAKAVEGHIPAFKTPVLRTKSLPGGFNPEKPVQGAPTNDEGGLP